MKHSYSTEAKYIAKLAFRSTIITLILINIWSTYQSEGILFWYSILTLISTILCLVGAITEKMNAYFGMVLCTGALTAFGMFCNIMYKDINTSDIGAALVWSLKSMLYPFVVWIIVFLVSSLVYFISDKYSEIR